jgi:hypothetical protein
VSNKIKIKQLTSGLTPFGRVIISDGTEGVIFYNITGLTYNIQKGTTFPSIPSNGDLFYRTDVDILYHYDDSRTKWLSVSEISLNCGRTSAVAGGTIYMRVGDATQNSTTGFRMIRNGTIIGSSIQNNNVLTSARNIQIRVNNSTINSITLNIAVGQSGVSVNNSNLDFSQGDLIQVVAVPSSTGSALSSPIVVIKIAFRV